MSQIERQPTELTLRGQRATGEVALRGVEGVGSLYVHVPFCFHKCHYCDFYSFVDSRDRQGVFLERLKAELGVLAGHAGALRTVFVGGGTPSLLRAELWEDLLGWLRERFAFGEGYEFTVECNPETVTPELMGVLAAGGVNRVSVGAQSFDRRHLATLERWHEPENVGRALAMARDAGIERRSLDLIFAIPGQTLGEWERDLETALGLPVDHLSCYALTYEPNTAMTKRLERGEFTGADEDLEADMYERTVEMLGSAGFERYEVSNFARSGMACAHNMVYWRGEEWLAAGPSGSAHAGGQRWKNIPHLTEWMDGVARSGGYSPIVDFEGRDGVRALCERIMLGLRLGEGLDAEDLQRRAASLGVWEALRVRIEAHRRSGMLTDERERVRLSGRGFLFADGIASDRMSAAQEKTPG